MKSTFQKKLKSWAVVIGEDFEKDEERKAFLREKHGEHT